MSLMTAGKQISVGSNQAFGRGLFVVDPDVAEREANKKNAYKQQLRMQMEEQARRKQQEKRKLREEDDRLEKKFYAELQKEAQKKNEKQPSRNDKNAPPPPHKSQMIKSELYKQAAQPTKRQDFDFKFSLRTNTEEDHSRNPYLQRQPNLYQMQQEQFFDQTSAQKLRAMKEMMQQKMNEVYRKINQSKDLEVEKELELIRKKINNTNISYENQNPKLKEFQNQFSQFYKIPKKMTYNQNTAKNLDYESRTQLKRNDYLPPQKYDSPYSVQERMPMSMSRNRQSRDSNISNNNNEGWGRKKGKNNFLGNRQAADFQIESISNNIDNILNKYEE